MKSMKLILLAGWLGGVVVSAAENPHVAALNGSPRDVADPRVRTFIMPTRIVWVSPPTEKSSVTNPDYLLRDKKGQIPDGAWMKADGCVLTNGGETASILVDFGRELHGGLQIGSGKGHPGVKARVCFGESVSEAMGRLGERNAVNHHAIRDDVTEVPWLGTRELGNTGFRFVRLDLISKGTLDLQWLRAISLMRPMPWLGSFACNDDRLNRIWATAARTVHLCCQDRIWDGIKRDRLVWMGDMHPELAAVMAVFGPQDIVPASLDYMREQTPADQWMNGMSPYTLWWIRCQHDWYRYTGDLAYLKAQHAYLKALFARLVTQIDAQNRSTIGAFLDWPTARNAAASRAGIQGLMLMTFEDGERLAAALADPELAAQCKAAAARLRAATVEAHGNKTAAAMLALSGLCDAKQMRDEVLGRDGVRGVSTFFGYYMLEAMAKAGDVPLGLDTVRRYWGGMLDMGATSFWEDFNIEWTTNAFRIDELPVPGKQDIHGDFGDHCYVGFRHSLCHGWSAGPAPWLIHHVLGIQPVEVGCKTVRIKPGLGDLQWAEGGFPTPHGVVKVRHERQSDGRVKSEFSGPPGVKVVLDGDNDGRR